MKTILEFYQATILLTITTIAFVVTTINLIIGFVQQFNTCADASMLGNKFGVIILTAFMSVVCGYLLHIVFEDDRDSQKYQMK